MKNEERWIKSQIIVELVPYNKETIEDDKKTSEFIKELITNIGGNNLFTPLVFSSVAEDDYTRFLDALKKEGTISPVIEYELQQREYTKEQEGIVGFAFLYEGHVVVRTVRDKFVYVHLCFDKDIEKQEVVQFINKFWDAKESNVTTIFNLFTKESEVVSKQYKFPKLRLV